VARPRKAQPSDIGELALALPETVEAIAWGDRPAYQVRGKSFVIYRNARPDALDADGERLTDVVVFSCSSAEEKEGLLASGPPRFTTPHFDGYSSILVRLSELGPGHPRRARGGRGGRLAGWGAEGVGQGVAGREAGPWRSWRGLSLRR